MLATLGSKDNRHILLNDESQPAYTCDSSLAIQIEGATVKSRTLTIETPRKYN